MPQSGARAARSVCDPMKPLMVRLPNHLGDACMCTAALDALAGAGYTLALAGRPWSAALFAAYHWPMIPLGKHRLDNVRALRSAARGSPGLLFTNSFSTAAEFWLARIRTTGYARGGRSLLLERPVPVNAADHMVEYYHRLAMALLQRTAPVPPALDLKIDAAARDRARAALDRAGVGSPYVVLCPVAVGRHRGNLKAWDGFTRLQSDLVARGEHVVAMPGPGESGEVRRVLPQATLLPESDVGTFAAVLAGARLVVANDSGPGHLAAAVGARLVSVFGVTEPEKTRPWGPRVTLVGSRTGWPRYEEVAAAIDAALGG